VGHHDGADDVAKCRGPPFLRPLASPISDPNWWLTRRLTALSHQVSVANSRGPETLADLAAETGAKPVSVAEAARSGEVVVVTIPEKNIPKLPRDLFAATPDNVVIVDTGNYYPRQRDGRIDAIEAGMTESRWVAQQLNRPVVKAFNNIYARQTG
jgi:predicted dinucleotide-binding enzyme